MALNNAYAQYNNNRILTASPAEITLMLYEGAIKFCNIAIVGVEQHNVAKAHNAIMRTQHIIEEFQITLDHKYEVAKEFDEVYTFILLKLREANISKDKVILEEVLVYLRTMRDTWKEVMRRNKMTV